MNEPPRGPRFIPNDNYGPPSGPPPGQPPAGGWPAEPPGGTPPPPRKRHLLRNILLSIGAFFLAGGIASAVVNGHTNTAASSSAGVSPSANSPSQAPASQAAAAPATAPSLQTPTKVEFIVSGYAPGDGYGNGPTVDYGSDGSTHEAQPASISGTLTYSIPFDPSAQYYSLNAQLTGSGQLSCKIVVTGPYPDKPLTVSSGNASGGYSICSAQAAPTDSTGLNWQNEQ
jgi:hypothetical protein